MEQNETDFSDDTAGLTENQLAALPYLVASPSLSEAARLASVARATIYRWMNDPEFRNAFERLRAQAADLAHAELKGLMLKGALVLAETMEDPNPRVRVRAAHAALSIALKAIDLKEIQQRIDRLDHAWALWAEKHAGR
jgi:hypothetical protein